MQDGLILYYDAINNTGNGHSSSTTTWKDLSGNGNDGTLNNINFDATSGWQSDGLVLDGVDDFVQSINPAYTTDGDKNDITVEVVSSKAEVKYGALLSFTHHVNQLGFLDLWTATQDYRIYQVMFSYVCTVIKGKTFSLSEYPIGTTKTVSYGIDGNNYFAYLNASNKGTEQVLSTDIGWQGNDFIIGKAISNNFYFKGTVKCIRIYNRALSLEEIISNNEIDKARFGVQ